MIFVLISGLNNHKNQKTFYKNVDDILESIMNNAIQEIKKPHITNEKRR